MGARQAMGRSRRMANGRQREHLSTPAQIAADVGVAVLAGATGYLLARGPLELRWPWPLLVAIAVALSAVAWRRWPEITKLGLVVIGWVVLVPVVTFMFSATTLGLGLDYQGRIGALALFGVLVALLAFRYSVGRAWLTALLVFGTVLAVACLCFQFGWSWGLWPAYGLGLLVLALRSGGTAWLWDMWDLAGEWRDRRRGMSGVDATSWTDPSGAEIATAGLLIRLPEEYRTAHDRVIPGSKDDAVTIDHIVIGPRGIIVLGSLSCMGGKIHTKPNGSLWHSGQRLDEAIRRVAWQSSVVAHITGLPTSSVLVIQGTAQIKVALPLRIALLDHRGDEDEQHLGEVTVAAGGADDGHELLKLVEAGALMTDYTPSQIKRYFRRITRALPARRVVQASSWQVRDEIASLYPQTADTVAIDDDGEVLTEDKATPPPAEHREYEWGSSDELDASAEDALSTIATCSFKVGDRVHALRQDGMLVGWVVAGEPYVHADHALPVVDIVDGAEWAAAEQHAREPGGILAEPIANLTPAE